MNPSAGLAAPGKRRGARIRAKRLAPDPLLAVFWAFLRVLAFVFAVLCGGVYYLFHHHSPGDESRSQEVVQQELQEHLPRGTPLGKVLLYVQTKGLENEGYRAQNRMIKAEARGPSSFGVASLYSYTFRFNASKRLQTIEVVENVDCM